MSRRIILLLLLVTGICNMGMAGKRVKSLVYSSAFGFGEYFRLEFSYFDDSERPKKILEYQEMEGSEYENEEIPSELNFDWSEYESKGIVKLILEDPEYYSEEVLYLDEDGFAVKTEILGSKGGKPSEVWFYDIGIDGHFNSITRRYGSDAERIINYDWFDGRMLKSSFISFGDPCGSYTFTYPSDNEQIVYTKSNFLANLIDSIISASDTPFILNFVGCTGSEQVPNAMQYAEDDSDTPIYFTKVRTITDEEGYIKNLLIEDSGPIIALNVFWEDSSSGVEEVVMPGAVEDTYYSIDGLKLDAPRKGLNIVRRKNGTTEKIMIK